MIPTPLGALPIVLTPGIKLEAGLKGAARGVGAFAMGEAAATAEPVDPAINHDRAVEVIEALRVEGEAVQEFIASYLAA